MTDPEIISASRAAKASTFAAALNDPRRARIGNPRRGSYNVAVLVAEEEAALIAELNELRVEHQINPRADGLRYIAIYGVDSLRVLLEQIGPQVTPERRDALELLVRARGPIPEKILEGIRYRYYGSGWDEEQIAKAMNEKPIVDGMKKGWSARKVRQILNKD